MTFQKSYRVKPDQKIKLADWDPSDTSLYDGEKDDGQEKSQELAKQLESLQELLYAQHSHKILVVLQGMDTSGKDGAVKSLIRGMNPQGVNVFSFKKPSEHELERDYLWRVHRRVPRKGHITIFNRSHYEDILVPMVEGTATPQVLKNRMRQITQFEKMLSEEGTKILKLFLHIDPEEQRKRLQSRLDHPEKNWKFNINDLESRKKWTQFERAYEEIFANTSEEVAPWYIIPANKKWYRNLVVSSLLVDLLQGLKMEYPKVKGIADLKIPEAK